MEFELGFWANSSGLRFRVDGGGVMADIHWKSFANFICVEGKKSINNVRERETRGLQNGRIILRK